MRGLSKEKKYFYLHTSIYEQECISFVWKKDSLFAAV